MRDDHSTISHYSPCVYVKNLVNITSAVFSLVVPGRTARLQANTLLNAVCVIVNPLRNGPSMDRPYRKCSVQTKHVELIRTARALLQSARTSYSLNEIARSVRVGELGSLPEEMEAGQHSPFAQKADKEDASNFRSVSLLPLFGKIIKRVVHI